jgi:hypothetical protein
MASCLVTSAIVPAPTLRPPAASSLPPSRYDAGNVASTGFDPKESFRAHKAAWPNAAIALGIEVGRGVS